MRSCETRFFRKKPAHESIRWANGTSIIWHPDEVRTHFEQPRNSFCRFRHTFDSAEQVRSAEIRLFADSRYMLFVNGRYVGRGPCRSDPRWQYYDSWNIQPLLRAGQNTIAVLVLHFGYGTGQSIHRIPALLAECALVHADGSEWSIHTDASWKCSLHPGYERRAPRINGCQGPVEIFDARLADGGWIELGYDDSGWTSAKARNRKLSPFWNLVPREIPHMEEGEKSATAVVGAGHLVERLDEGGTPDRLHRLLLAEESGLSVSSVQPGQAIEGYTVPPSAPGQAAVVTLDFGLLEVGYLQLEASGGDGDILDIVYAEELWEGKALLNETNNRSIDRFLLAEGLNRVEIAFGWKAFRYVQIRVRNRSRPVIFHRVGLRTRRYPLQRHSNFTCSDEAFNRLWSISAHTLRCCMQDGFLDSSSREQQQWMGDGRVQAIYNYYYSGDSRLHRKLLGQFGQSQEPTGLTASRYPDEHHNYPPIPSFCLHWVASMAEYERFAGDTALKAEWWPNLVQALRWFTAYLNEDGLLDNVPYWPFIDWGEFPDGPSPDVKRGGVVTALNIQYVEVLRVAAEFASQLGDAEAKEVFGRLARHTAEAIRAKLWNEEAGAYTECLVNGQMSEQISEIANSLALLHVHEPGEEQAERIVRVIFEESGKKPAIQASPYFMLYVYRALQKHGRDDVALNLIRGRYKAMLEAGATTLWENWKLFFTPASGGVKFQSASHAWGAMPLVFAAEQLLGLRPGEQGFRRTVIAPKLFDLSYAEGRICTPAGEYRIAVAREGEGLRLNVTVPEGCEARIGGRLCGPGEHMALLKEDTGIDG